MNEAQREALKDLCRRYNVEFREEDYSPQFDLPSGYVAGWVGGKEHARLRIGNQVYTPTDAGISAGFPRPTIYVGVSPEGEVSS